ncbi:MAG TPA: lysoplasmalogenase [Anaerolineales bacterium]|nr:lysoplasmalogenase [Anaerolineales bacterium]
MLIWLMLALIAALAEAVAVQRNIKKLEFFAKPAVMIFLWIWLYESTALQGVTFWFGIGIFMSLLGDMALLSSSDRMFLLGLVAFLLTHVFYLIGFKDELLNFTAWSTVLILFIYVNSVRLLRRIASAMQANGKGALSIPVIVYGLVISLMLYAAMATMYDPAWKTSAALLVTVGAILFWISDLILAWNKFVSPLKRGRILNILSYHLGQIGLIAGVINQFLSTHS